LLVPNDDVLQAIDQYCARLHKALGHLPSIERDEIVDEVRSHVLERVSAETVVTMDVVSDVLHAVGDPQELASGYRTDAALRKAAASRSPWLLLLATLRWATTGLAGFVAFVIALTGYGSAAFFYLCAFIKPFAPSRIGLWLGQETLAFGCWNGRVTGAEFYGVSARPPASFVLLGTLGPTDGPVREILGAWFIPTGILCGALVLVATTLFVRWLIRTFGLSKRTGSPLLRSSTLGIA
jgi:hypothetical protein